MRLAPVVLAPVLVGPVFLNRDDPLVAGLVAGAVVAALRARDRTWRSGALVGVGTAMKLYPRRPRPRSSRGARARLRARGSRLPDSPSRCSSSCSSPGLPGGAGYSLWTQLRRHLQIESLGSSILLVGSKLGIHHVQWIAGKPGSIDLGGTLPDVVAGVSSVASIVLVLLVAWAYWRGADDDERLVTACAASIAAFTVFGKVLSPQYLTWLLPLAPLAAGRRGLWAAGTLLAALALSMPEYLSGNRHGAQRETWTVWVLLLRNGLPVAMFCISPLPSCV